MTTVDTLTDQLRLQDTSFFADPYDTFATFRSTAPVFWYEPLQCWAVFTHAEIRQVLRDTASFSSEQGILIGDNMTEGRGREGWPPDGEPLLIVDPPRHHKMRAIISKGFTPRMVAELEPQIRARVNAALDRMAPGDEIDFVEAYAKPIPAQVMIDLLGVPHDREADFVRWTDTMIQFMSNPDLEAAMELQELLDFWAWCLEAIEERRENPGDDLISRLIASEVDGESLSEMNLVTFCVLLLVGGLETARNLVSGGAKALAEEPGQRDLLLRRPELIGNAVDELLRWITPAVATARTAKVDTMVGTQPIRAGDYVVMLFQSANRDENVYERADQLDVSRTIDPMHVSFGWGAHLCLGAALARLEVSIMFEEFLRRFPNYELLGPGVRLASVLMNGYRELPMRLAT